MKRAERNEYNYIRRTCREINPMGYGTQLTIRTNASAEYKQALHELYTSLGFHPASVRIDTHWFDENERIIYIYGMTWQDNEGRDHSWSELYTTEEKERFSAALR